MFNGSLGELRADGRRRPRLTLAIMYDGLYLRLGVFLFGVVDGQCLKITSFLISIYGGVKCHN